MSLNFLSQIEAQYEFTLSIFIEKIENKNHEGLMKHHIYIYIVNLYFDWHAVYKEVCVHIKENAFSLALL